MENQLKDLLFIKFKSVIIIFLFISSCYYLLSSNVSIARPDIINNSNGIPGVNWTFTSSGLPNNENVYRVIFCDVNKDGYQDIVSATDGDGIRVYLGNGLGNWTPVNNQPTTKGGFCDVCVGDIFNNGNLDIFAAAPGYNIVTPTGLHVYKGDGTGNFSEITTNLPSSGVWRGLNCADMNHDGNLDLIAVCISGNYIGLHCFTGDGKGDFTDNSTGLPISDFREAGTAIADFNNDGNLDIAAGIASGIGVFLGNGGYSGKMEWTSSSIGLPSGGYTGITAADINNDGMTDLILSNYWEASGIRVYKNNNNASSWSNYSTGLPTAGPYVDAVVGDFNADGFPDIVSGEIQNKTGSLYVFYGNGKGTWFENSTNLPGPMREYVGFDVGDMNNDGKPDILCGRYRGAGIEVWKNSRVGPDFPKISLLQSWKDYAITGGKTHDISWSASSGVPPYNIDISYSVNGGISYSSVTSVIQNNTGLNDYLWNTPVINQNNVKLKVEVIDSLNQNVSAFSNVFRIVSKPPVILEVYPKDGDTNVTVDSLIQIKFDTNMNKTATQNAISISGTGNPVLKYPIWDGWSTINLQTFGLLNWTQYNITISTNAKDYSNPGNFLKNNYTFKFTTSNSIEHPYILDTNPKNLETNVSTGTDLVIEFSHIMNMTATEHAITFKPIINSTFTWNPNVTVLTFNFNSKLATGTQYSICIGTNATDISGNALKARYYINFTTAIAPIVLSTSPPDNSNDVSTDIKIVITFNENMNITSTNAAVSITPGSIIKIEWNSIATVMTLTVSLEQGKKYTLTINKGVTDAQGEVLKNKVILVFTTKSSLNDSLVYVATTVFIVILIVIFLLFIIKKYNANQKRLARKHKMVKEGKQINPKKPQVTKKGERKSNR